MYFHQVYAPDMPQQLRNHLSVLQAHREEQAVLLELQLEPLHLPYLQASLYRFDLRRLVIWRLQEPRSYEIDCVMRFQYVLPLNVLVATLHQQGEHRKHRHLI